jgi:putative NIF3 family GTP cyclohydrolase 1 type 2
MNKSTKRVIPNYTDGLQDGIETKRIYRNTFSKSQDVAISTQLEDFERAENIKKQLLASDVNQFTILEVHHTP